MNGTDLIAILPLLVLGGAVTIVMLAIAFYRNHRLTALALLLGLILCLVAIWPASAVAPRQVTPLFIIDGYALFYMGLIFAASIAVLLLSYGYLADAPRPAGRVLSARAAGDARRRRPGRQRSLRILLPRPRNAQHLAARPHRLSARPRAKPMEAGVKYLILAGLLFRISAVRHGPDLCPAGHPGICSDRGVARRAQ